ncbi:protein Jade-1 isoform X2 [Denticeps clupeoides]|uniref:protein Jade-1 isoform X2 n=1 Tax=Denticeps clupeoides TaxID=299321 RepID=UPI0010A3FD41|nr:E3 ubiquitin-protein ligase Jade-2 isoform X2 [Denticeps clupeoides]XP_028839246.1 E3 ubiquitin-protein ligase Jade-2 isoform X2 [Denticeps clupeoides]XP_028839247.1 E3 ubiquitin-protein ligase Jade-2 isoform X2 [Denticeps clupeoides]
MGSTGAEKALRGLQRAPSALTQDPVSSRIDVFRTDFITAMKLPDSAQMIPEEYYILTDPWRQEWEKGVQVPANVEAIPEPVVRVLPEVNRIPFYSPTHTRMHTESGHSESPSLADPLTRYDLDDLDVAWLELVNTEFRELALPELDELTMERVLEELESQCEEKMQLAIATQEGLGIEYDEDVVCDVCRSPEGEDGNEMVFCDKCNICVHQACYGILKVPQGNWLCRTCALGVQPKCLLCPKRVGALKPTRSGTKWVHVSCALWIPEVSIGCPEKMEPITKVSHIPASRWALSCSLCKEHTGTCIQCSMPSCIIAFHVTCAFDHGLEMRTILAENDEVRFKSFCLEHSSRVHNGKAERPDRDQTELEKASQRKQKLQELEDEFYRLVDPKEVADNLGLPDVHVDFLFQFWKLRRKSNFNQPLVAAKRDEVDNLAQQEQDVLYRRLKLFTHLRQDLERVRNLCYMVTRRERMKLSLCDLQEKIFHLQIQLLEDDLAGDKSLKGEKGRQNGVKERRKSSPEKKDRWKSENRSLLKELGLPLDGSLFDSWLAQSVQITADDMLSQWSLGGNRRDKTVSLFSDQLLQDEQNLLRLMMDQSVQSTWKTPQLGRKGRGKPRGRGHKPPSPAVSNGQRPTSRAKVGCQGLVEEKVGHRGRRGERLRTSKALMHHQMQTRSVDPQLDSPQPPVSKMDSCHISDNHGTWHSQKEPGNPVSTTNSVGGIGTRAALRLRLARQGKRCFKSSGQEGAELRPQRAEEAALLDTDTDGYYSDREHKDLDSRSLGRKLRLGQLHAGSEEVLRRGVLAS